MDEFDQMVLTRSESKDLHKAYKNKILFRAMLQDDALLKYALLSPTSGNIKNNIVRVIISDRGRRYVLYTRRKHIDKWVPLIMSATAVAISLIALLSELGILQLR